MIQQAFGDDSMSRGRVFEWYARFKAGRDSLEDDERSGRPCTSKTPENVEEIRQLITEDARLTIFQLCDEVGISYGPCQEILTEVLKLRRVAAKWVPRLLTPDQKQRRVGVCVELRQSAVEDPDFFSKIITGDETWVYGYDPETKQQSSEWRSKDAPRPKKARQVKSSQKSMLIVFFDVKGVVHKEFVPPGATVNADFYMNVLRRLREDIRRKRPELWANQSWLLHHDNAPAHRALKTVQFLAKNNMTAVPHPPYSPDLAPCDFALFPKLKLRLKGRRFDSIEEIQRKSQEVLDSFEESDFRGAFETWKNRLDRCIASQGEYFEGDHKNN